MAHYFSEPSGFQHSLSERAISRLSQLTTSDDRVPTGLVGARLDQLNTLATHRNPNKPLLRRERASTTLGWGRRVDAVFAKPASRNTEYLDKSVLPSLGHSYLGAVTERHKHREGHSLIKPFVASNKSQLSLREHQRPSQHPPSGSQLPTENIAQAQLYKGPLGLESGHRHRTIARTLPCADSRGKGFSEMSSAETSDSRSASTSARQRDALDIFDHYGISRPGGWLSEDDAKDRTQQHAAMDCVSCQRCHACSGMLSTRTQCTHCGHITCPKCVHTRATTESTGSSQVNHPLNSNANQETELSTPRARTPTASPDLSVMTNNPGPPNASDMLPVKTGFEGSGLVKNNPFFRLDRAVRGKTPSPQTTMEAAEAYRSTRHSDCVPGCHPEDGFGYLRSYGGPSCADKTIAHSLYPSADSAARADTHEGYRGLINDHVPQGPHVQQVPSASDKSNRPSSLEVKIAELQYHAQDLHHSQHILQDLSAGSRGIQTGHMNLTPTSNDHSEKHGIAADEVQPVHQPNTHEIGSDVKSIHLDEHDFLHDLSSDIPVLQSLEVHELEEHSLPSSQHWQRFHGRLESQSVRTVDSSQRLRPASPKS